VRFFHLSLTRPPPIPKHTHTVTLAHTIISLQIYAHTNEEELDVDRYEDEYDEIEMMCVAANSTCHSSLKCLEKLAQTPVTCSC
jgi:hypothetical protein